MSASNLHIVVVILIKREVHLLIRLGRDKCDVQLHADPIGGQCAKQTVLGIIQVQPQITATERNPDRARMIGLIIGYLPATVCVLSIPCRPIGPSRNEIPAVRQKRTAVRISEVVDVGCPHGLVQPFKREGKQNHERHQTNF